MGSDVEAALLACLEQFEAGRPVDAAWVEREFPGCESAVLDFVGMQRRLRRGRPSTGRIGPYHLRRRLGRGGMGTVYLAQAGDDEPVAIKLLQAPVTGNRRRLERVLAEARAGTDVRHPNLVPLLDCGIDGHGEDARVYLVFEAVSGQTLRGLLDDLGSVPETHARWIGEEVADALTAVHAGGLVHGDVKPENVILAADGSVWLLDLGAVRGSDPSEMATDGVFVGSMLYAAPEQLSAGPAPIDGRADLHALGLVLYELVTGRHPFGRARLPDDPSGSRPVPPDPCLSPTLARVLDDLLALDRCDRPPSAAAVRDLLSGAERESRERAQSDAARSDVTTTPLRGRDTELLELQAAVDASRTVLVEGAPGIGKSRLLDELVAGRVADEHLLVLHGSFAAGDAFADALRPHVSGAALALDALSTATLAAYLGDAPVEAAVSLPELQASVTALVSSWSRVRPVLLAIDDLHLADADGLALFEHVTGLHDPSIAIVAAARPELPAAWRDGLLCDASASVLTLAPLPSRAMRGVVTDLLGSDASERLVAWCVDHSRGHPLLARETIRWMRSADGRLSDAGGVWDLVGDLEGVPPSDSVREVVSARLDRLPPPVRDLLDAAACGGSEFDLPLLAAVLDRPVRALDDELAGIASEYGVIARAGAGFTFDHRLVREVLHDDLHPALRRQLHGSWADALESSGGDIAGSAAVRLVTHLIEAGRGTAALEALTPALAHLDGAVRPHAALDLVERVLHTLGEDHPVETVTLQERRARRLLKLGRFNAFDAAMQEAWAVAHHAGALERARLHDLSAQRAVLVGDTRSAEREVETAQALAAQGPEVPSALQASLTHSLGRVAWVVGRVEDAQGLFLRAAALSHAAGDLESESFSRAMAASALASTVAAEESVRASEEADAFARAHGSARTRAAARRTFGRALWRAGRSAEGVAPLEQALNLSVRAGSWSSLPAIEIDLSRALAATGRFDEALARAESASSRALQLGSPGIEAYTHVCRGDLLMELGDLDAAATGYLTAARVLRRQGVRMTAESIARIARVRAARGRYREAIRVYEHASAGMYDTQFIRVEAGFRIEFAEACLAVGDVDRARDLASTARVRGGDSLGPGIEAAAIAVEAACAWQADDPRAEQLTEQALQRAERSQAEQHLAVLRRAVGGWMAFRRRDAAARLALRVTAETTGCPMTWQRALPLALAARADRDAGIEARSLLREHGHRLPLLDRIAAHAHLWLASGDGDDLAAARRLLAESGCATELIDADPTVAAVATPL